MGVRFRARIELGGRTATGFRVPADVVEALGSGKKPRVYVTIGGHTYRSTVALYGGEFILPLSAENRTSAGVAAGDEVDVEVKLDTEPRHVTVPADFAAALDQDADDRQRFDGLSYSKKRQHVSAIDTLRPAPYLVASSAGPL